MARRDRLIDLIRQAVFLLSPVGMAGRTLAALHDQHVGLQPPQFVQGQSFHQSRIGEKEIARVKHGVGARVAG
jgi:hypothetical protein